MDSVLRRFYQYTKILNIHNNDKCIREYEIDVPNPESLELNEIEKKAAKNGIHIYDVKTESYMENNNRKIIFKVKESNKPEFKTKFENIKTDFEKKGLNIKPHNPPSTIKKK